MKQRWMKKEKKETPTDILHDICLIREFLKDILIDRDQLLKEIKELEELEEERQIATQKLKEINLKTQIKLMENILQRYSFFKEDALINGIRVKNISKQILHNAEILGLKEIVKEKKKDPLWQSNL